MWDALANPTHSVDSLLRFRPLGICSGALTEVLGKLRG